MAIVSYALQVFDGGNLIIVSWPGMSSGDTGVPFARGGLVDRSLQAEGTFGVGGAAILEGSNDGVNFHILTDPFSNPLSLTAAGVKQATEISGFVRPRIATGDGTTSLTCTMAFHRSFPVFAI
jgi:hypothetical protein